MEESIQTSMQKLESVAQKMTDLTQKNVSGLDSSVPRNALLYTMYNSWNTSGT